VTVWPRKGAQGASAIYSLALSIALALPLPAAAEASASQAAAQTPATFDSLGNEAPDPSTQRAVPGVPIAQDIEALSAIPLRREIARAEGRIGDLEKSRDEALAGFAAAVTAAEAQAAARARAAAAQAAAAPGEPVASPASPASALLDPGRRAERRRAIVQRYADRLEAARRRLAQLLARQARIDPDAPDQQRLGDAATAGVQTR
jgi:hypothetical protein